MIATSPRALLLERHDWETSGSEHQVQVPKQAFLQFFGTPGSVGLRVFDPPTAGTPQAHSLLLSRYEQSDTYRFNWMTEFGALGHAILVFEETGDAAAPYDAWWFTGADATSVLAQPHSWQQAKDSQHGPGRKWVIIAAPAPRVP